MRKKNIIKYIFILHALFLFNEASGQTYETLGNLVFRQVGCTNTFTTTCITPSKAVPPAGAIYTYSGGYLYPTTSTTQYQTLQPNSGIPSCVSCNPPTGFSGSLSASYSSPGTISISGATAIGGTSPYLYLFEYATSPSGSRTVINGWTSSTSTSISGISGTVYIFQTAKASCGSSSISGPSTSVNGACVTVTASSNPSSINTGGSSTLSVSTSGGSGNFSYNWSNGSSSTTTSVSPTSNTTYSVTVTDNQWGCSSVGSVTVIVSGGGSTCTPPTSGGTITVSPSTTTVGQPITIGSTSPATGGSGGTIQYTFSYITNGVSTQFAGPQSSPTATFTPTQVKTYCFRRSATMSCGSVSALSNLSNCVNVTSGSCPLTATASSNPSSISTGNSSTITATPSNGSGGYTYTWSNGSSFQSQSVSPTSTTTYFVTITDNSGCTATASTTVTVSGGTTCTLTATASSSPSSITSGSSSTLSVTPSGGSGNYTYSWSNGASGTSFITVSPTSTTTYTVTVTDNSDGCTATASTTVTVNSSGGGNCGLSVSTSASQYFANAGDNVSIWASTTGGSGNYTYSWDDGFNNIGGGYAQVVTPAQTTNYNVTVTDYTTGCTATGSVLITVSGCNFSVSASASPSTINIGGNTTLTATPSNPNYTYTYNWSNGLGSGMTKSASPSSTTTYTVTVTDNTGCATTANATVGVIQAVTCPILPKKLLASDGVPPDQFGNSVAVSGDYAIVGALGKQSPPLDNEPHSGVIYIYKKIGHTWTEIKKIAAPKIIGAGLYANNLGNTFGYSVAISGNYALVGVPYDDEGAGNGGAVYIYEKDQGGTDNWGQVQKIKQFWLSTYFGCSVSIDGDYFVAGAYGYHNTSTPNRNHGTAYVYQRQSGTHNWNMVKQLNEPWSSRRIDDEFGYSVSISGDYVVVGVPSEDISGNNQIGAAYIFEKNTGGTNNWGEVKKIIASDGQTGDFFGFDVAISGDYVIVGAPYEDTPISAAGTAYIFGKDVGGTNNWGEVQKIIPPNTQHIDKTGWSVDMLGNKTIIGTLSGDAAYLYERASNSTNWNLVKTIEPFDGFTNNNHFGESVALGTDVAFIGAPYDDDNGGYQAGAVYLASLSPDTTKINETICQGENFTLGTQNYNTSGTYMIRLPDVNSCDSLIELTLTVLNNNVTSGGTITGNETSCGSFNPSAITSSSAASGGNGTIQYIWEQSTDGGTTWSEISGATSLTYNPSSITQTVQYRRGARSSLCTAYTYSNIVTKEVIINLVDGGTIGWDEEYCFNYDAAPILEVGIVSGGNGGTVEYIWEESTNGGITWTTVNGETNTSYNPNVITQTTMYRRGARRSPCSTYIYSNVVTKTVNNNINITTQPTNVNICQGSSGTFTMVASGTGLSYQWYWSNDGVTLGSPATETGNTTSSITVTNTNLYYAVVVTDGNGCSITSDFVTLNEITSITNGGTITANETNCGNFNPNNITETVAASGGNGGTIEYIWEESTDGGISWTTISGATSTSYNPSTIAQTTLYRRGARYNSCSTPYTYSNIVVKEITTPYTGAGTISSDQTICFGDAITNITGTFPTGGSGAIEFIWEKSTNGGATWSVVSGTNTLNYQPTGLTTTTIYRRGAKASGCSTYIYSNTVTKTIIGGGSGLTITSQPTSIDICTGNSGTFTVAASGTGLTYQWYSSNDGVNIGSAATETGNTTPSITVSNTNLYYAVVVTDVNGCNVTSNFVQLNEVINLTNAGTIAADESNCDSFNPALITSINPASGGSSTIPIFYQWQSSADSLIWTNITGATSETYDPASISQTTYYRRRATRQPCTNYLYSNTITKEVTAPYTSAGTISSDETICLGDDATTITGTLPTGGTGTIEYIWEASTDGGTTWTVISSATAATYQPLGLTDTTSYRRGAKGSGCPSYLYSNIIAKNVINNGAAFTYDEIQKLLASDGQSGDYLGYSVSISGDYAIVGASYEDQNGSSAGAAYIFEKNAGGTNNWSEVKKLVASDGQSYHYFGNAVSISGDYAIVGAYGEDQNGSRAGAAYIFEKNAGGTNNWGEVKKIVASDGQSYHYFGLDVSILGDYAIVGAQGEDQNGTSAGAAYIFEKNTGGTNNWGEVKKIVASDGQTQDYFGRSVSISGDYAIVGAQGEDQNGTSAGAAYIFEKNTGGTNNWGEVKKIVASDGQSQNYFGQSVSISGDYVIVGAYEDQNGTNAGAAYIFEKNTGGTNKWGEVKKIVASDGEANDDFGRSVFISGDYAIVGARFEDQNATNAGAAYIFEKNTDGTNNWGEVKKIVASDGQGNNYFGHSVSISSNNVIVGAYSTEAAYLFSILPDTLIVQDTICQGESVTIGTQTFNSTGLYLVPLTDINGCDSTIKYDLLVVDTLTDGGIIAADEANCGSFNPALITSTNSASGGSSTIPISYQWQMSLDSMNWTNITGATSETYDPASISQTTYYRRGATRSPCANYIYSNVVTKRIGATIGDIDTDGDGYTNQCDLDDDNDGILDDVECPDNLVSTSFSTSNGNTVTFNAPAADKGFVFDVHSLDNSFNLNINGVPLVPLELQFEIAGFSSGQSLVVFKSDNSTYGNSGNHPIYLISNSSTAPVLRVVIDELGNVTLYGKRSTSSALEEVVIRSTDPPLNNITWDATGSNTVVLSHLVLGVTSISGTGSGVQSCTQDTDGDGSLDHLDLDSDNDGCPDAIEGSGNFTTTNIQNDTLTGGVDANGVPIIANGGQGIGNSQTYDAPPTITSFTDINPTCGQNNGSITINFNDDAAQTHIEFSLDGGTTYETAVADNSGSVTYANLSAGTYNIYAHWQGGECPVVVGIRTLINTSGISVTASNDQTICVGESVTLSANATGGTGTKTYQWNDNTGSPVGTGASISLSPTTTTTYSVIATDQNNCTDIDMVTVTVRDLPTATLSKTDPTSGLNNGSIMITYPNHSTETQLQFSLNGGSSYQPIVLDNSSQTTYSNLASGSYTIYARWGDGGCPVLIGSINLVNSGAPVVAIDDATICNGSSVTLQTTASAGMPPYSFSWSHGLGNGTSKTVSPTVTTTYTVTVTDVNGASSTDQAIVTVIPLPSATISKTDASCSQSNGRITFTFADEPSKTNIQFSLDGGATYQTAVGDHTDSVTYTGLAAGTYTLYAKWGDDSCPTSLGTVTLNDVVNPVYCNPSLTFQKSAVDNIQAGGFLKYTFTFVNNTGAILNNITLRDTLNNDVLFTTDARNLTNGIQVTGVPVRDSIADLTINNIPIGTSSFEIFIHIPLNYTGTNPYCNQAYISGLTANNPNLSDIQVSDNPNTGTPNDATCTYIWQPEICDNGIDDDLDGDIDCDDSDCQNIGTANQIQKGN